MNTDLFYVIRLELEFFFAQRKNTVPFHVSVVTLELYEYS